MELYNWYKYELGNVVEILNGYAFKSQKYVEHGIRVIRIANVQDGYVEDGKPAFYPEETEKEISNYLLNAGDLLMSLTGNVGRVAMLNECMLPAALNQRVACLRVKNEQILSIRYLYYYLRQDKFRKDCMNNSKGTAQLNMSTEWLRKYEILAPSLAEQKRIVEQIENLFYMLDEAKEKVQSVVDGYEARTASIYHDAFCGKLTEKWRADNDVESEWQVLRFDEVADIKSNLVDPSEYKEYPHIAPDNIEKRTGVLLEYYTIGEDGVTSGKHRFYPGQILYSKIRPYLSKVVMVDFDGLCSADMYPIEAKQNTRYLLYYMLSDEFLEQASSAGSRSVLPKINQKELSAVKVNITSEKEQAAVVEILDRILCISQKTKESAENVIEQIELVKKSILAKVFCG